MLNTYIYDHLCKLKLWDLARSFYHSCPIKADKTKKEMNGDDGADADSKDGVPRPEDLPLPNIGHHFSDNSFLFDWWCQFWDVYAAARQKGSPMYQSYYGHNVVGFKSMCEYTCTNANTVSESSEVAELEPAEHDGRRRKHDWPAWTAIRGHAAG